jgi:CubicO group peptidase (beta-lactamase class C family)
MKPFPRPPQVPLTCARPFFFRRSFGARLAASALALMVVAGAAHAAARPTPLPVTEVRTAGFSPARLERLHAFMRDTTAAGGYLGGVILIARDGKLVDWQAYGERDLARREPMRRDDIFRLYSMSKPIASVAVLMLMEEGRLGLEDPVSRFLPELAALQVVDGGSADAPRLRDPLRPVTIRALLTHTAGFAAGLPGDEIAGRLLERADTHGAADLRGFVERLAKVPLAADPGTRFGYDGAATEVLARVVEVVSGESFGAFLQERLFAPLGMRDTGFDVPPAQRDRVVDLTTLDDDGKLVLDSGPSARVPGARLNAYDSGAGGLYSTAADYARFCQMLLAGGTLDGVDILGRTTVDLMMRNHLTMLDPPVTQFSDAEGFGLGGYVVLDVAKRGVAGSVGQFGWTGAASTVFWIDREERVLAILLLQHLPREHPRDLPRVSRRVQALIYQALAD